jgi:hypothetical protein
VNDRQLNRALLSRQRLIRRSPADAEELVAGLAGLNAQLPDIPYLSLLARVEGFEPAHLSRLVAERRVVRATWIRGTLHLVRARDYLARRADLQPVLTRIYRSDFRREAPATDTARVLERARALLEERPMTRAELGAALEDLEPEGFERRSAAFCARMLLTLVQVAPSGEWAWYGNPRYALAERHLAAPLAEPGPGLRALALGYFAAFGPATVRDLRYWSGLTGLAEMCRSLGDRLVRSRHDDGRVLYDVAGAALPDPGVPAPCRLLPAYDNALYAHADRSRIVPEAHRRVISGGMGTPATLLVDGMVAGTWRLERRRDEAALWLRPFATVPRSGRRELEAEARRVLATVAPDARRADVGYADP